MIRLCTDPTFMGTAIYTTVNHKTLKLSHLKSVTILPGGGLWGAIEFDTLHSTYRAEFTDNKTRETFLETCETLGLLK